MDVMRYGICLQCGQKTLILSNGFCADCVPRNELINRENAVPTELCLKCGGKLFSPKLGDVSYSVCVQCGYILRIDLQTGLITKEQNQNVRFPIRR